MECGFEPWQSVLLLPLSLLTHVVFLFISVTTSLGHPQSTKVISTALYASQELSEYFPSERITRAALVF